MKEIIIVFWPLILLGGVAIGGIITAYINGWNDDGDILIEGERKNN